MPSSLASYLQTPRIHFAGHYRADAETTNNMPCNFDVDLAYDSDVNKDWNGMGTNEFAFQNTIVYGAVGNHGEADSHDSVIGASVLDNGKAPFGKIVIQDVDTENTTALYGLRFGIGWKQDEEGQINYAFYGNWTPNIISQMTWHKVKCYNDSMMQDTFPRGVLATTTLTDVEWKDGDLKSDVLEQLREESQNNNNTLQVSLMLYFYTRNHPEYVNKNFTLGYVVGTVGVYKEGEPLNYGGERLLAPIEQPKAPSGLVFDKNDSCYDKDPNLFNPWMYKAPFIVNDERSFLTVDLSNSLPITTNAVRRDIGNVYIGLLRDTCVELVSEVPYLDDNWLRETGGVVDFKLDTNQMTYAKQNAKIVAVIEQTDGDLMECGQKLLSGTDTTHKYIVMLMEEEFYVRPQGFYNARLEKGDVFHLDLYVSHLGLPAANKLTAVSEYRQSELLPHLGVEVTGNAGQYDREILLYAISITGDDGLAHFNFTVDKEMTSERWYPESPCPNITSNKSLPIDGQSYQFKYTICKHGCAPEELYVDSPLADITPISIRAFSSNTADPPYKWKTDIYPIFHQYYHLYPVMSTIMNLSDFDSVTTYPNLKLLLHSMDRDFNDPNFMPATRDLPPSKQEMVIDWLKYRLTFYGKDIKYAASDDPFDHSPELVQVPICRPINHGVAVSTFEEYSSAKVCTYKKIPFDVSEACNYTDLYYIFDIIRTPLRSNNQEDQCTRPLYGYKKSSTNPNIQNLCTKKNIQDQLQLAVQIEFATIPIYLTGLYSIEKACNEEIYNMIRSVVMQEMLHFIQAANILIATGAYPSIDTEDFVPSFPRAGLPGCVAPNLNVYLARYSPQLVNDLFVAIEQPHLTCVATMFPEYANNTIGQFYKEIEECIETQGDKIFLPNESEQVSWPWPILQGSPLGILHQITDVSSALAGIKEIVDQGEGASPIDPFMIEHSGELAHYYQFQELVCQRHLVVTEDGNHYAYNGTKIPYNSRGVYHMRPDPRSKTVLPDTNCYTEAKTFHHVFRALLKELQVTFSGHPDHIFKTIELMELLQVHLKRVMRVMFDPTGKDRKQTCGPVWDYNWEGPE